MFVTILVISYTIISCFHKITRCIHKRQINKQQRHSWQNNTTNIKKARHRQQHEKKEDFCVKIVKLKKMTSNLPYSLSTIPWRPIGMEEELHIFQTWLLDACLLHDPDALTLDDTKWQQNNDANESLIPAMVPQSNFYHLTIYGCVRDGKCVKSVLIRECMSSEITDVSRYCILQTSDGGATYLSLTTF
jgi:hypothetical protein